MEKKCFTCNKKVLGDFVQFRCPQCAEETIVRCLKCRENARTYECKKCGFIGP